MNNIYIHKRFIGFTLFFTTMYTIIYTLDYWFLWRLPATGIFYNYRKILLFSFLRGLDFPYLKGCPETLLVVLLGSIMTSSCITYIIFKKIKDNPRIGGEILKKYFVWLNFIFVSIITITLALDTARPYACSCFFYNYIPYYLLTISISYMILYNHKNIRNIHIILLCFIVFFTLISLVDFWFMKQFLGTTVYYGIVSHTNMKPYFIFNRLNLDVNERNYYVIFLTFLMFIICSYLGSIVYKKTFISRKKNILLIKKIVCILYFCQSNIQFVLGIICSREIFPYTRLKEAQFAPTYLLALIVCYIAFLQLSAKKKDCEIIA